MLQKTRATRIDTENEKRAQGAVQVTGGRRELLTVAEIYCGAGGLSAGFKNAAAKWHGNKGQKFKIVYGVDRDADAIRTFRKYHFPKLDDERLEVVAPCKDIKDVAARDILNAIRPHRKIDVLIGGPSCQGVSTAGLRNPDDARNTMLLAFIELVRELRPKWFVIENVPGLTHENNRELLAEIFNRFESIDGYEVRGDVLLAADYGVPQLRYRLFIIGTNTGSPIRFPAATYHPASQDKSRRLPQVGTIYQTVRQAIFDLAKVEPEVYDKKTPPDDRRRKSRAYHNHYCIELGELTRKRIGTIGQGEDWRFMPVKLLPESYFATRASDQKGAYGRLLWDWPAYTITNATYNVTAGPFIHPEQDRALSVREAARLQSFSDEHIFYGNVMSQYRQVGNAVPPKLAQAVAEAILYCHYQRRAARAWGRTGRLSYQFIREAVEGKIQFPTMTPRLVHPNGRRAQKKTRMPTVVSNEATTLSTSVWDQRRRPPDPRPEDTQRLRKLAQQPGHYRAAKRARTIVQFIDGISKTLILKNANVSESSVRKWVNGYFAHGLDGWRAYHTSASRIAGDDPKLIDQITKATSRVRRTLLSPSKNGGSSGVRRRRLHMNGYLNKLVVRFGRRSVAELMSSAEEKLGAGVGTVYVGDLLAICSVVQEYQRRVAHKRRRVA